MQNQARSLRQSQRRKAFAAHVAFRHKVQKILTGRRPRTSKRLPRQVEPKTVILRYFKALLNILNTTHAILKARILDQGEALVKEALLARGDSNEGVTSQLTVEARQDAGKRLNRLFEQVTREVAEELPPAKLEALSEQIATQTSEAQKTELQRQIKAALGTDILAAEPNLTVPIDNFVGENVALITSIPSQYLEQVQGVLQRGITDGTRWEDIADEISDRFGVAEDRAALIARDQVGKFFGDLNELRQTELGVTEYVWRTVHDARVRPEHAEYDGNTYSWDSPPEDGHPGEAINCRCYAEPVLTDILNPDGDPGESDS